MSRLTKRQKEFLQAYERLGVITYAARAAHVHRSVVYDWKANKPEFVAAFAEAQQVAADLVMVEARRRAIEGAPRIQFGRKGKPLIDPETGKPYKIHYYSDKILIRLLEAHFPDLFSRRPADDYSKLTLDELLAECAKSGIVFQEPGAGAGTGS